MSYLYVNFIDLFSPKKDNNNLFALSMVFDLNQPIIVPYGNRIDSQVIELTHTKYGVPLDEQLGEFWVKELKKKSIRSFLRKRQIKRRK